MHLLEPLESPLLKVRVLFVDPSLAKTSSTPPFSAFSSAKVGGAVRENGAFRFLTGPARQSTTCMDAFPPHGTTQRNYSSSSGGRDS